jgi:hypothetical protein
MSNITTRATKADILAAYEVALAELDHYRAGNVTWRQVRLFLADRSQCAWKEARLLVSDVQKLGSLARQWVSLIVDTYRKPVLRSKT